jgi:hypothetical protein
MRLSPSDDEALAGIVTDDGVDLLRDGLKCRSIPAVVSEITGPR